MNKFISSFYSQPKVIEHFACDTKLDRPINVPDSYQEQITYGIHSRERPIITCELPIDHSLDCNDPIIKKYIDQVVYILGYYPFTDDNSYFKNTLDHYWSWDYNKLNYLVDISKVIYSPIKISFDMYVKPNNTVDDMINEIITKTATTLNIPKENINITIIDEFNNIKKNISLSHNNIESLTAIATIQPLPDKNITNDQIVSSLQNLNNGEVYENSIFYIKDNNITSFFDPIIQYSLPIMFLSVIIYSIMELTNNAMKNILSKIASTCINILIIFLGYISTCIWFKKRHLLYPKYTTIAYKSQIK